MLDDTALSINLDEFVAIRRDLHAHPELSNQEERTAGKIAGHLRVLGYEVHTGIGGHGVIGLLKRGTRTRSIAIRADFDALPVREETGLPHESRHIGTMHACGHDGHTATLLAAAAEIAASAQFDGTFVALFQPAEETGHGAKRMLADGLLTRFPFDAVFGLHNVPGSPTGKLGFRSGPFWAAVDDVDITLQGFGGHGGRPHLARDPLVAAAQMVLAFQTIVARNVDPIETAVVTIGALQAGTTNNVIPDTARLALNIRSFTPHSRELVLRRIHEIVDGIAAAAQVTAEIVVDRGTPPVVNDPAMTDYALNLARSLYGDDQVDPNAELLSYSDDFSDFLIERPGSYIVIGNGTEGVPLHHPKYDFNDSVISRGAHFWTKLVEVYLAPEVMPSVS